MEISCCDDDFDNKTSLLNIPFHILEVIMEHCLSLEYINFRATCKRCNLAAPLMRWKMYSPWLMVFDKRQGIIAFIDPMSGDKYSIKTPQQLNGDCQMLCCRFGWLLMFKAQTRELMLFNPFTSNIYKLPSVPFRFTSLCFSAPPTSPDCMVVGFTQGMPFHVCVHFVSREPASWRTYSFDSGPCSFLFPTFSGRDIWALCDNDRIVTFRDIGGEEGYSCEVVKDKAPRISCGSHTQHFLSKCAQHLLLVIVINLGESVEVFKLNDSTNEWEKIHDLGKHMIYVFETSCICLEAKVPQMGNKIYFPKLLHNTRTKLVFYSLETCRFHTFDDKVIQESFGFDLSQAYEYIYPHIWIEPTWS